MRKNHSGVRPWLHSLISNDQLAMYSNDQSVCSQNNPDPPGNGYDGEAPPGYVYLKGIHMEGAIQAPQTTPEQRNLAIQINYSDKYRSG